MCCYMLLFLLVSYCLAPIGESKGEWGEGAVLLQKMDKHATTKSTSIILNNYHYTLSLLFTDRVKEPTAGPPRK